MTESYTQEEFDKVMEVVQDNYGISEACQEFLGWSKKESKEADGTNWDDVVEEILTNPDLIGTKNEILN